MAELDQRCWIVRRQGEGISAEERHYTEQQAREEAETLNADGEPATVEQLTAPCVELTCQGCGWRVDEDDEGIIHFESIQQAREYVTGIGYDGVVFAGDQLIRCNADCTGSDPADDGSQTNG